MKTASLRKTLERLLAKQVFNGLFTWAGLAIAASHFRHTFAVVTKWAKYFGNPA